MMNIKKIAIAAGFLLQCLAGHTQQGWWSAKLRRSDNNDIAFTFEWKQEHGKPVWYIHNAAEQIKVDSVTVQGDSVWVQMPVFESRFKLRYYKDGLTGVWIKGSTAGNQVVPFVAVKGNKRFSETGAAAVNITGRWAATFSGSAGELSVGEFKHAGNKVTGTFLNPTGDYRYLEGIVVKDSLLLSGFDGGHALLFTAKITSNKKITDGRLFFGPVYKEDWTAVKDAKATVSETSVAMYARPGEDHLHFSFKDLDGKTVSINDNRYKDKVVVIQLMGSWCPNCMDETAFLSDYYNHNKDRGVEVIALAYEYSTDWERSVKSLRKFQQRFNVQYAVLSTGVTVQDSLRTEKTLPELTPIKFFPSSVILDKKGKIRKLDTGFNGPGTGEHYTVYKKEFEETIDGLLKEK